MPRDGSGIYVKPFPSVVDGTTIESAVHNGEMNDIAFDLNAPRPIVAGGTGASSADVALFNLSGEKAAQVVTNYDTQLWMPGSFRSAAGATSAPNGTGVFAGTAIIGEALANPPTNQNLVIEARDLSDASVPGLKYVREKTAGVWSAWTVDAGSQSVRFDSAQSLTAAQQTQARQNIYAAPFDALAYNGMQINGSMEVHQEGTASVSFAGTQTKGGFIDGWIGLMSLSSGQLTMNQQGLAAEAPGFNRCIQMVPTVAQASLSGSDFVRVGQKIEGYRFSRMAWGTASAVPLTIGFWARASTTGTYRILVQNFDGSLTTAWVPFTITGAAGFQWVTITIPAQTTGVWKADNTVGALILIEIASSATANTVAAGGYFSITGVVVLPGIEAPAAARAPLIMRPYDQELLTCQRYFRQYGTGVGTNEPIVDGQCSSPTGAYYIVPLTPTMRATPTYNLIGTFATHSANTSLVPLSALTMPSATPYAAALIGTTASGLVAGDATKLIAAATNSRLIFDARL